MHQYTMTKDEPLFRQAKANADLLSGVSPLDFDFNTETFTINFQSDSFSQSLSYTVNMVFGCVVLEFSCKMCFPSPVVWWTSGFSVQRLKIWRILGFLA